MCGWDVWGQTVLAMTCHHTGFPRVVIQLAGKSATSYSHVQKSMQVPIIVQYKNRCNIQKDGQCPYPMKDRLVEPV
jgi:hypothetical protein